MLLLTRKSGERIIVNDEIIITVESIHPQSVRLSFDYPKHCRVLREEVYERIKQENLAASASTTNIDLEHIQNILKNTPKQ